MPGKQIHYVVIFFVFLVAQSGCATKLGLHTSTLDDKTGVGAAINMGELHVGENLTFNGTAGFDSYKKNKNYDTFLKAGIQGRYRIRSTSLWFGPEFSYVYDIQRDEEYRINTDKKNNGFMYGGIAATRLPLEKVNVDLFVKIASVHFGENETNTMTTKPEGNHIGYFVGLEIALPFAK